MQKSALHEFPLLDWAGHQGAVLHAVDDLFVRGAKGGKCPAPLRLVAQDEKVGRKAQAADH